MSAPSRSFRRNTTLYGHNWYNIYTPRTLENMQSNDLMFSLVMSYHYTDFAQQNPFIYFSTTEQDYVFQVFAAFYTDLSFGYNFANMTQEQTQQVIAEAKAKSRQNYNVSVTSEDKILTLSTCTRMYGNTNNQRFVVMGKTGSGRHTVHHHQHPHQRGRLQRQGWQRIIFDFQLHCDKRLLPIWEEPFGLRGGGVYSTREAGST